MKPLVIITGPTAVGKSDLAVRLAKRIQGEIISADSMQVYRGMDIGSAKITREEMMGVPHYLIDCLDPEEEFNVVLFKKLALEAMDKIYAHGNIPIIAGGTGFYIQALLYDIDFSESAGEISDYRKALEERALKEGPEGLYEELMKVDPESCLIIHKNNVKRVIRALEFFNETGKKISEHNKEQHENQSPYNFLYYVLNDERDLIYKRIDKRVDKMIELGLVSEVKALKARGLTKDFISMQGLGYKEILDYLDGNLTLDEALYIIKRDTRHFAKRQLTWFKREKEVIWLDRPLFNNDTDLILEKIVSDLKLKGIIND